MKKIFFLIVLTVLFFACTNSVVPKPDTLLEEDIMVNILYDVALLQASEGYMPEKLKEKKIKPNDYIYTKYKIDSTIYFQNQIYYAANMAMYKNMNKEVLNRLNKNKIELDTILKGEGKEKLKLEIK